MIKYIELYKSVILAHIFKKSQTACLKNREQFQSGCEANTIAMIEKLFRELKQFQFQ